MIKINRKIKSLYIHIPFCDHICIYCDFYKMMAKDNEIEKYIDYLIKELHLRRPFLYDIETVYIGGGTPSILKLPLLEKLLKAINEEIPNDFIEFTIEANPKDITNEFIELIMKYNCNRLSLGVQSFNDEKLKFLRRNHDANTAINALKLLNEHNFGDINCDLIYGVNNDNINTIKNDLDILLKYNVTHISTYSLIIEDKTILNTMVKNHTFTPMDDDIDSDIYDFICSYLNDSGFTHYEVSNFCKPGYESVHNLCYWNCDNYLGIGASASYLLDNERFTNINKLPLYYSWVDSGLKDECYFEHLKLNIENQMFDFVMMGLRKMKGINTTEFKTRFNRDIIDRYKGFIPLLNENIVQYCRTGLRMNPERIYIMNKVLRDVLND